jgi:hypothetical protein
MGLLDTIATAQGGGTAAYAKQGRHLVRLSEAFLHEPGTGNPPRANMSSGFRGVQVHSTSEDYPNGTTITVNSPGKFPQTDLAKLRNGLAAAKQVKEGLSKCNAATLGLAKDDKESDAEFNARIAAEARRLLGPDQPLSGALVVFACVNKTTRAGGVFTEFAVEVPTNEDLARAGLV